MQENIELALDDLEPSSSLSVAVVDQASSQTLVRGLHTPSLPLHRAGGTWGTWGTWGTSLGPTFYILNVIYYHLKSRNNDLVLLLFGSF